MASYTAPLDDIRFVLHELLDYEGTIAGLPGYEDGSRDVVDAILEEAARFCENELMPLNRSGDEEGCTFENGVVRTPKGFKEAYDAFAQGGWIGLACDSEHGGMGLPKALQVVLDEMVCSTNLSFGMYPGLSHGAYNALAMHGDDHQKSVYIPHLVDGTWSGTMCLTEPQCGTDLGLIRTKADPADDGSYRITGTKIFISAGEHDLTENIVHLVLAKLPDAPAGTRGISMFIVPKFMVGPDGALGPRNGVSCGAIEHKMGIHGSSTCVMNFDEAVGYLVGEPHKGMRYMFTMMNAARLAVGVQGLGVAETAYQSAVAYARDRLQGRALEGAAEPKKPADPIIVHPDVRRTLMTMRACNEAARALALWVGMALDISEKHPDPEARKEADDLVQLMTPVIKAYFTDHGFAAANMGVQVLGGHGYIREHGMEQLVRDARITQLYEGTNGIQALDLVRRKLQQDGGKAAAALVSDMRATIETLNAASQPSLTAIANALDPAIDALENVTAWIATTFRDDPIAAASGATPYMRMLGFTAGGWLMADAALKAAAKLQAGDGDSAFYTAKIDTARFFAEQYLPPAAALAGPIMMSKETVMAIPEDAL